MANIKDVAEMAGVSTATVSNVINESKYVTSETKEKVLKSMDKLNYSPNNIARSLRSKKSKTIGFLLPDISNFFFTEIIQRLEKELKEKGYSIILASSDENLEREKEQIKLLTSYQIEGLVIAPVSGDHSYLKEIRKRKKFPIIFIDRKPIGIKGTSIITDNFSGAYKAVKHLINKKHKNIAIIAGLPGITSTRERLEAYKKALEDHNLCYPGEYIKYGDSTYESGYRMAKEIINTPKVTAIFTANNLMTLGAMTYLVEHGIKIPEDIAIVSFDDFKWAEITSPPLTSVRQKTDQIAVKAAYHLFEEIENGNNDFENVETKTIRIDCNLIIRDST